MQISTIPSDTRHKLDEIDGIEIIVRVLKHSGHIEQIINSTHSKLNNKYALERYKLNIHKTIQCN